MQKLFSIIISLLIFVGCGPSSSNKAEADNSSATDSTSNDITITITVKTTQILADRPVDSLVNNYVKLSDASNTSDYGDDHSLFTTDVYPGFGVNWVAVPEDSTSENSVEIQNITRKPRRPVQILTQNPVNGNSTNRLRGQVKGNASQGQEQHYNIRLKVSPPPASGPPFITVVDPKLKADPQGLFPKK